MVVLSAESIAEEVAFATPYHATVANIKQYGVFVTLAGTFPDDVGGLVHKSKLPTLYRPDDFTPGDTLVVQLYERQDNGDLAFETIEVLEGAKGTTGVRGAPVRDYSPPPDENEADGDGENENESESTDKTETPTTESGHTSPAATASASQGRLETIITRLDAMEAHLGMKSETATVRARVLDAGEETTLLRVLDDATEIDAANGEVVTAVLHETAPQTNGSETT